MYCSAVFVYLARMQGNLAVLLLQKHTCKPTYKRARRETHQKGVYSTEQPRGNWSVVYRLAEFEGGIIWCLFCILQDLHLYGFSLGGQGVGHMGRKLASITGKKADRLTGIIRNCSFLMTTQWGKEGEGDFTQLHNFFSSQWPSGTVLWCNGPNCLGLQGWCRVCGRHSC